MGEKWLYNAPIVVFPPSHFFGGKLTMGGGGGGGEWLYYTGEWKIVLWGASCNMNSLNTMFKFYL